MGRLIRLILVLLIAVAGLSFAAETSDAQTRRAFVVGVSKYREGIRELALPTQDADDIAKSLSEVGFDPKNIKLFKNPPTREVFLTEFNKFLETISEGDIVFFYFSGHGYGSTTPDGQPQNYLLFTDIKSPIEFARAQASDAEKKSPQLLAARAESKQVLIDYETIEVPARGISEKEILTRIQAKKPRVAIVVLDACRTLLIAKAKGVGRVTTTGTNVRIAGDVPAGFMVIYSASHGQDAIERFSETDNRRNSLFTSVFREFIVKPGLDLTRIAKRVQDRVSQLATNAGYGQDPEFIDRIRNGDFYFVDPVGGDRYELASDPCEFAAIDIRQLRDQPNRDRLERHLKYFSQCSTAEEAMRLRELLSHGTFDKTERVDVVTGGRTNPCDRLAASEEDAQRPPDVSGVRFDRIEPDEAVAACTKAADENPRVVRYLFNLARAYQRQALALLKNETAKREAERNALFRYQDVVARGYVAAFNNLAIMYDNGEGVRTDSTEATRLLRLGAEQGHPLAMYNLALRYKLGKGGLSRSPERAYELLAKAAEAGNVSAMVLVGNALRVGYGVKPNPKRAAEWLIRASSVGSTEAKRELGLLYFIGAGREFPKDDPQALLWFAQAAEAGDALAQHIMALMFAEGWGIASPQPQIAERYWRLAAYGGYVDAQLQFAERILSARVLVRPENAADEAVQLLKLAMTLGSSRAALRLAKVYRKGELGFAVRPEEAVRYAYRAIDLASQTSGTSRVASLADHPLDEIAAGILLVEMAANGEAVDADRKPLLTPEEEQRLQHFYGRPDPETKLVKVRSLKVEMDCGGVTNQKFIWVWDWGREESPTEAQFRYYENQNPSCRPVADAFLQNAKGSTRDTLNALWQTVRRDGKISFADIVFAQSEQTTNAPVEQPSNRRRRR